MIAQIATSVIVIVAVAYLTYKFYKIIINDMDSHDDCG